MIGEKKMKFGLIRFGKEKLEQLEELKLKIGKKERSFGKEENLV